MLLKFYRFVAGQRSYGKLSWDGPDFCLPLRCIVFDRGSPTLHGLEIDPLFVWPIRFQISSMPPFTFLSCRWLLVEFLSGLVLLTIFIMRNVRQPIDLASGFLVLWWAFVFFRTAVDCFCLKSKFSHRRKTAISAAEQFPAQLCPSKLLNQDFSKDSRAPNPSSISLTKNSVIFDKLH